MRRANGCLRAFGLSTDPPPVPEVFGSEEDPTHNPALISNSPVKFFWEVCFDW